MRSLYALAIMASLPALAGSPRLYFAETSDLRLVYYSPTHAYLVPHLMRSYENSFGFHSRLWHYRPALGDKAYHSVRRLHGYLFTGMQVQHRWLKVS